MRLCAPSVPSALIAMLCLGACATGASEPVRLVSGCLGPLPLSAEFLGGYAKALTAAREDLEPRHAETLEEGAALWLAERDRARACAGENFGFRKLQSDQILPAARISGADNP